MTMPYQSVHIGPALKRAREHSRLTQDELARLLGVDESVPSRWECVGSTRYTAVPGFRLPQLAEIFGLSVHELAPHAEAYGQMAQWLDSDEEDDHMVAQADELTDGLAESSYATVPPAPEIRYTLGDLSACSPVPGRPSAEWKVRCWHCHRSNAITRIDHQDACDRCGSRLRAEVKVTLLHGPFPE
jgi:transcriptional regulator with XRE-family HTH domain/DNA-directed RNA polymerase subunit RPC12/RpoP